MSNLTRKLLTNPSVYSSYPVGIQTKSSADLTSGTVSVDFGAGASVGDGDFIVCCLLVGSTGGETGTLDTNGGQWTEQATESATTATYKATLSLVSGFATATNASISWTLSGSSLAIIGGRVYRYVDLTTPLDVAVQTAAHNATCIADPPSITPTTANTIIFGFGGCIHNDGSKTLSTSDFDNVDAIALSFGTPDGRMTFGDKEWVSGAFDASAFNVNSDTTSGSAVSGVVAIRPQ